MAYVNVKEKSDLVNIRKNLQKRFLNEKLGEQDIYQENIKLLQPLIEPIKDITTHQKKILKSQPVVTAITSHQSPLAIEDVPVSPHTPEYGLLKLGRISDKYMKTIASYTEYDNAFGIQPIEGSTDFKLGKEKVKIDGNNLIINKKQYIGTEGLWKLLTSKYPGNVSKSDYDNYKKIMLQTKAFLKDDGTVKSNRGEKYKKIIKPIYDEYKLFEDIKKRTSELGEIVRTPRRISISTETPLRITNEDISGTGFKFLSSGPNELLNKHKILFLEMQAGNTNVFNELQAINDQLLKLKIFNKKDVESLNNFFLYNKW